MEDERSVKKTWKWKRIVSAFLVGMLVTGAWCSFAQPVSAAAKAYVLKEGKTQSVQLDGKGAKEKLRYEIAVEEKEDGGETRYLNQFTLYLNGAAVYKKSITTEYRRNYDSPTEEYQKLYGDVYIGSVDKTRKVMDIFIAIYDRPYTSAYEVLDYCRYENGKFKKVQDLNSYLYQTLSKQIGGLTKVNKDKFCYFHAMDRIEDSLNATGKNELLVTICLPDNNYKADKAMGVYHASYALKLKNGKLVKKYNKAHGAMNEGAFMIENVTFYTKPGGTKKAFVAKTDEMVYFVEYQYIGDVLYLKAENNSGKQGWTKANEMSYPIGNHIG